MSRKNSIRRKPRPKPRIRRRTQPGAMPGSLVVDASWPRPVIRVVAYGPDQFVEKEVRSLDKLDDYVGQYPVAWVQVMGLGDAATICRIGERFGLHLLALEDVVNLHQRAKVEQYGDQLFITARVVRSGEQVGTDQVGIFVGKNFVVSFQERCDECFAPVLDRLRSGRGRLRTAGPDHLAYALVDAVVDSYFPALDRLGERLDELDSRLSPRSSGHTIARIHELRSEFLLLRRAIWPHRDALNTLLRDSHALVTDETRVYFRDCYDHTVQIIDLLETYREMCGDLRDLVLSMVSNRLNEIMKVLTIIATIFIPLGFLAGVYGMNFDTSVSPWSMPELKWQWGYPFALALMAAVALGMLAFFWRRGWLGSADNGDDEPPGGEERGK
jgi:magnesium transporter